MTRTHTRVLAGLAAALAVVALSSCSTSATERADTSKAATQSESHNQDDVQFAQLMIPHHQQGVELGAMAAQHTSDPALVTLAGEIMTQQQPEINTMKTLLAQWGVNPDGASHQSGHDGLTMKGMVSEDTMVKLGALNGPDFEKLWLQSMISHHEGAIEMAKTEVKDGKNADMVALASGIITEQQTEIDQMKKMLAALGG